MNKIGFISYPSSGSYWLSHIVMNVFKCDIHLALNEHNIFSETIIKNDKYEIRKTHCVEKEHESYIKECNGLIMILRNYKECTIKRLKVNNKIDCLSERIKQEVSNKSYEEKDSNGYSVDYIRLLKIYDSFSFHKVLIYYEDLISDIEKEINKLKNFFNLFSIKGYSKDFLKNLEYHKNLSLNNYKDKIYELGGTTQGRNLLYHSKALTYEEKVDIDNFIFSNFPSLYNKYLIRYKEDS